MAATHDSEGTDQSMIFPQDATQRIDHQTASETFYDVVVVGSGVSGAIVAEQLSRAGKRVLVIDAAADEDRSLKGYEEYLSRFYAAASKDNQSPYPHNPNAPMPRSTDANRIWPGQPDTSAYLVQNGPFATDTTYTRVLGGTTMHWEAKTPRMLPEDFRMRSTFGLSQDWPVSYDDLSPYYIQAERELGVSADVEHQSYLGATFEPGYVFPMHELPLSYLDKVVAKGIDGTFVELDGEQFELTVRAFPQARNGIPNAAYDGGNGYVPVGAVNTHQVEEGGRCQGNNNCVPLCPVQAKYHAGKTLAKALQDGRVDLLTRTVASKVLVDPVTGRVDGIEVKVYQDPASPQHTTMIMRGQIFVLAANAIENPRLMLASGLASTSGLMGRNLMDHAYLLSWALLPEIAGTFRGTNCTGGIVELRAGSFRRQQAAFAVDIHNDGWGWATGAPYSDLVELIDKQNLFGGELRSALPDRISRQLLLALMIDVLPNESNRVTVDPAYTDQLGNMRPVISYTVPEYTMRGVAYARQFARQVFQRLGAADHTTYDPTDPAYLTYEGEGYVIRGGNHLAGTHIMGTSQENSVVDHRQRSWDHQNLYLVGGGSMPTIGTSNVTLTMAALCYRSAEHIIAQLHSERSVSIKP
jgi:choline dehydrogenase-like flavoprotein